jgi:hypothetical protein
MSSNEGIKQSQSQEKAIMRHSKLSIHWSIRRLQLNLLTATCLKMVARDSLLRLGKHCGCKDWLNED